MKNSKQETSEEKPIISSGYFSNYISWTLFVPIALLIIKLFHSKNHISIFINFFLELSIMFIIFYLTIILPSKKQFFKKQEFIGKIVFFTLLFWNVFLFTGNSVYFNDSLIMKYDFTKLDSETIKFFFKNIATIKSYFLLAGLFTITYFLKLIKIPKTIRKKIIKYSHWISLILLILTLIISMNFYNNISNQYVTSIKNRIIPYNSQTISLTKELQTINRSDFKNSISNYKDINFPDDQLIFVFVMEQTTKERFLNDLKNIPDDKNFFKQVENNSIFYSNYYTQNQDSRTSVWDLLNSEFSPFECYVNNWNNYYGTTLDSNNLVDFFNSKNYETVSATANYDVGLIAGAYNWDDLIVVNDFNPNDKKFICLHEFEYQKGCEDKILLPEIKNKILNVSEENKSLFFFQEMIFGHGETFMKKAKKTRVEYYNDYFFDIWNFLEKNNLLEKSTFIIVSDHGDKGYFKKETKHYNIPLVIINKKFSREENNNFYTHLSFKNILFENLAGIKNDFVEEETFLVGQTMSQELGYINSQGDFFMSDIEDNELTINSKSNINDKFINSKMNKYFSYQQLMINESLEEMNTCKYCSKNINKTEEKRKSLTFNYN